METCALKELMNQVINTRTFRSDPVPEELLGQILEAFRLGPSLANTQPWEVLVVEGEEARHRAAGATLDLLMTPGSYGGQGWVAKVPTLLAVCVDRPRAEGRIGPLGWSLATQDTGASLQNARLMATLLGLRTAICKELDSNRLREALELPWNVEPLWLLALGYSDAPLEMSPRLALRDFVHRGGWGQEWSG
jgi:5,6-dimethylbenzimidazole synthase